MIPMKLILITSDLLQYVLVCECVCVCVYVNVNLLVSGWGIRYVLMLKVNFGSSPNVTF